MVEIKNVDEFDSLIKENETVIVKFGAEWCGPCSTLHPILETLSNEMTNVKFAEVDVEEVSELASRYKVRSIPVTLVFKNGTLTDKFVGASSEANMREKIQKCL